MKLSQFNICIKEVNYSKKNNKEFDEKNRKSYIPLQVIQEGDVVKIQMLKNENG